MIAYLAEFTGGGLDWTHALALFTFFFFFFFSFAYLFSFSFFRNSKRIKIPRARGVEVEIGLPSTLRRLIKRKK